VSALPGPEHWLVLVVFVPLLAAAAWSWLGARAGPWAARAERRLVDRRGRACRCTRPWPHGEPVRHTAGRLDAAAGHRAGGRRLALAFIVLTLLIGIAVSVYAVSVLPPAPEGRRIAFWVLWLMLWSALNATFVSADLFNLYVVLELTTLSAVPLAALGGGRAALSAAMRYLLFALLGSLATCWAWR
jgi:multicomponent Na+:H+ antiporter subunit D